jgi:hypothetical protein
MAELVTGWIKKDVRLIQNPRGNWEESPAPGAGTLFQRGEPATVESKSAHVLDLENQTAVARAAKRKSENAAQPMATKQETNTADIPAGRGPGRPKRGKGKAK